MMLESKKILTTNKGISLISLIITIIVIIILAAIVIFSGLGTPDSANLAKFTSEFADFNLAVDNAYMKEVEKNALANESRSKKQVYYEIATGIDIVETNAGNVNQVPTATGTVADLEARLGKIYPETLEGEEYYTITSDTNVYNWKNQKQYFEEGETHYLTDEGEAFFLPGYLVQEDDGSQKWFINETKYYYGEKQTGEGGVVTPPPQGGDLPQISANEQSKLTAGGIRVLTAEQITDNDYKNNSNIRMVIDAGEGTMQVPIPEGFYYYEGTGEDGLVVGDAEENGNEFVWIPATGSQIYTSDGTEIELSGKYSYNGNVVKTKKWEKGSSITDVPSGSGYRGPDLVTDYDTNTTYLGYAGFSTAGGLANDLVTYFDEMTASVDKYGGFYVGRYELGHDDTKLVCKPGVKAVTNKNGSPATNTYASEDTQMWYGLYRACKNLEVASTAVVPGMIWSSQWDAMVTFLGTEATSTTEVTTTSSSSRKLTGNWNDEVKNVCDTRGSLWDWTATAGFTLGRAYRGGSYDYARSASYRSSGTAFDTGGNYGARPQLYIKL